MTTAKRFTCFVLATLVWTAAWAGDDDSKQCGAETDACVRELVDKLSNRGWVGIEWDHNAEHADGHRLSLVVADSPGQRAGLEVGDKLLAFNGVPTSAGEEAVWAEAKRSLIPEKTIVLTIERAGEKKDVEVLLGRIPRAVMAQWIGNHVLDHHVAQSQAASEDKDTESP